MPTPAARNSPFLDVLHLLTDVLSFESVECSNTRVCSGDATVSRTRRDHFSASVAVWLARITLLSGKWPRNHDGRQWLAYVLFAPTRRQADHAVVPLVVEYAPLQFVADVPVVQRGRDPHHLLRVVGEVLLRVGAAGDLVGQQLLECGARRLLGSVHFHVLQWAYNQIQFDQLHSASGCHQQYDDIVISA